MAQPPAAEPSAALLSFLRELHRGWRDDADAHKLAFEGYSVASTNGAVSEWWPTVESAPADSPTVWLCFVPGRGLWEGARVPLRIDWFEGFPEEPPKFSFPPKVFHPNLYPSGKLCPHGRAAPRPQGPFDVHDKELCSFLNPVHHGLLQDRDPSTLLKRMLTAVANSFLVRFNNIDAAQEPAWRQFNLSYANGCARMRQEAVKYGAPESETLLLATPPHFDAPLPFSQLKKISQLSADFSALLRDQSLADISLRCGEECLRAHRLVLCARSPVFRAQLSGALSKPGLTEEVEVSPEFDLSTMERLLEWIYGEEFECGLSAEGAQTLLAAADFYSLHDLVGACAKHLVAHMQTDNAVASLLLAHAHGVPALKRAALVFLSTRAVEAMRSPHWGRLTALPRPQPEGVALVDEVLFAVARGRPLDEGEMGRGTKRRREGQEEE